MLKNVPLMLDITREVVKAVKVPVTVKTRLGWDSNDLIISELAEQLQDCGIQALTIHGRTRSQMYTGEADWSLIGEVKNNPRIHIPIIGNGDIGSIAEAHEAFDRYGVDAVMIGRAMWSALANIGAFCTHAATWRPVRYSRVFPISGRRVLPCYGLRRWRS